MPPKTRNAPRRANALKQLRNARMRAAADGNPTPVNFFWDDPTLLTVDAGDTFEIHFNDLIDDWFGISSSMIVEALIAADGRDVLVHLNSPGGMVFEGMSIHSQFAQYSGKVTMRVEGLAASAASFVMLAADEVLIEPSAMVMIHDAWDVTVGPEAEHIKTAGVLGKLSASIASMYAAKSGNETDWRAAMIEETWYVGQEAVDAGLVDALTTDTPVAEDTAAAATDWRTVFDIAPRRPVDLDAPPPVLPAGLEHLDLAEVAQAVAAWRAQKTAPAPVAAADNQQTTVQWSSFLDRMKGLKAS